MSDPRGSRTPAAWRERAKLAAAALISALTVLFAVLNVREVQVNWIFGTWTTPLIVVIVASGLSGAAIALLVVRQGRKR